MNGDFAGDTVADAAVTDPGNPGADAPTHEPTTAAPSPLPHSPGSGSAADHPSRPAHQTRWDKALPKEPAAPSDTVVDEALTEELTPTKSRWRTPLWIVGLIVIGVVIAIALKGKLPKPSEIGTALVDAHWGWVIVGGIVMVVSVVAFAEQQRQLLAAFDVGIGWRRIIVITFGGTALTNSLPAGAAVAAGFSFAQYRQSGANRSTSATVMVLSGLLSVGSLALLYFVVLGTATATPILTLLIENPVVVSLVAVLLIGVVVLLVRRWLAGRPTEISESPTPRLDRFEQRWPKVGAFARDGLETVRQAQLVKVRYLTSAIGLSVLKWVTEAICLIAACAAFDISIDLVAMSVIYLSVQLVRQIPFTPGGIGLVEASLLAGLVSAGAAHGPAAAAVLIYRVLSAWLIIPVGFALLAEMKRRDARRALLLADAES